MATKFVYIQFIVSLFYIARDFIRFPHLTVCLLFLFFLLLTMKRLHSYCAVVNARFTKNENANNDFKLNKRTIKLISDKILRGTP